MVNLFGGIHRKIERIKRSREIINVLIKHGFGHFIAQLDLKLPGRGKPADEVEKIPVPVRARLVLEELGPTFVKFGQMLSLRPDLIPHEFVEEFRKLQDSVPGFSFQEVESVVIDELGSPVDELFYSFDRDPIAAASIAQVHKAVLDGKDVVVKLQRPRIGDTIEADLDILFNLARLVTKHIPESQLYNPVGIVEEFAKAIRKELDFAVEGRNMDKFAKNFEDDPIVCVLRVYWDFSSKKILIMDFVKGTKVSELDEKLSDEVRLDLAEKIAESCLKQILVHGFFHADPHPGNILVIRNEKIAFLDFGIMGRVDDYLKEKLGGMFIGIIQKDTDRIIDEFLDIGMVDEETSLSDFREDIEGLIETYYGTTLGQVNVSVMMNEALKVALRHRIRIPTDFVLLIKALVTVEGVCRQLNPAFNLTEVSKPFVESLVAERMHPRRLLHRVVESLSELNELAKVLPRRLDHIMSLLEKGKLLIDLEHKGLNKLISELDVSSNRLSMSLIISSIIIGSSVILLTGADPLISGLPVFGIIGYLIAGILGIFLVVSILRSGRF